jgi:kanamycin kinase/aminoglycoside 3'-phosphotransferase-2
MTDPIASLRARYSGHTWTPVRIGQSGAKVWRLESASDLFLKTVPPGQSPEVTTEAKALEWLAAHDLGAPEVVATGTADEGWEYLVTTAVAGRSAAEPWSASDRPAIIDAIARFADRVHSLPADDCPFVNRLHPDEPAEHPVVCHGDFMLPNVIIDPVTLEVTGIIDVGDLGLADPYRDYADMAWSLSGGLNPQYGREYADRFLRNVTGGALDRKKLAYCESLRYHE